ncbi:hypothetical protein [Halococcoides cellulosivorans]|uniref:Uncharacterized protein n=1 Tax=Halococcoides cellulosivorans TaxID=1679096 RepID=A0A2R4WXZ6_9EURY|nr:hypothetical protein [Halococcoides cellulosivorans]AWB26417.1 hypothetical protein HARCEL1_01110 [Halococcoides cellulosivorans]
MRGLADPDGPVPAIVTVAVLGVVYLTVLSVWTVLRAGRQGGDAIVRQAARVGRWLPTPSRPA